MFRMISGLLAKMFFLTVAVTRRLFASKGRQTVPDGVFHSAVVIDRVSNETIPIYQRSAEVPAVYVAADGRTPMIVDGCDRLLIPMFDLDPDSLDAVGFSALDAALGVVDPATGELFNALISVAGSLGRQSFNDAYTEVEKHGFSVTRLFMNPRDYYRDLHYSRNKCHDSFCGSTRGILTHAIPDGVFAHDLVDIDKTGAIHGVVAKLWGAAIVLSGDVAAGTVYVCTDKEHLGVMPMRGSSVGIGIHNPRGVSSIKVVRNY